MHKSFIECTLLVTCPSWIICCSQIIHHSKNPNHLLFIGDKMHTIHLSFIGHSSFINHLCSSLTNHLCSQIVQTSYIIHAQTSQVTHVHRSFIIHNYRLFIVHKSHIICHSQNESFQQCRNISPHISFIECIKGIECIVCHSHTARIGVTTQMKKNVVSFLMRVHNFGH
jgi:hypothetical protein